MRVPTIFNWPGTLKTAVVTEPVHMVDVMPTGLALAGAAPNPADKPLEDRNFLPMLTEGKPSPHEDILVNVEAFRGAIIKGKWKLVKTALLPGKIELFDLQVDPGENNNSRSLCFPSHEGSIPFPWPDPQCRRDGERISMNEDPPSGYR